jgi:hypothetical protein
MPSAASSATSDMATSERGASGVRVSTGVKYVMAAKTMGMAPTANTRCQNAAGGQSRQAAPPASASAAPAAVSAASRAGE